MNKIPNIPWMCSLSVKDNNQLKTIKERTPFLRALGAIIHSSQFRRLSHKAQVHLNPNSDFIRTRLTHSLEVSQVGNQLARIMVKNLDIKEYNSDKYTGDFRHDFVDLVTVACLAHDIGQAPFGHAGERKLNLLAENYGAKFEANKQNIRLLLGSEMRKPYDVPYCLVDAIFKYKEGLNSKPEKSGCYESEKENVSIILKNTTLKKIRHPACYLMEAADDIGYLCGDIEDAIKFDLIQKEELTELLNGLPIYDENYNKILKSVLDWEKIVNENWYNPTRLSSYLIKTLIVHCESVINEITQKCDNILDLPQIMYEHIKKNHNKDEAYNILYCISKKSKIKDEVKILKDGLYKKYILKSEKLNETEFFGEKIIEDLWNILMTLKGKDKEQIQKERAFKVLPEHVQNGINNYLIKHKKVHNNVLAMLICDYISGMTDRYAISLWEKTHTPITLKIAA